MLKQVPHDGRGRYKISCKSIGEKSGDLGGVFLYPIAQQFIADTQYFGHAVCVFMRCAKQKAWRGGQDYLGNIHEQKIPCARRGVGRFFPAFRLRCARSGWWRCEAG
jgi:hypothetical protein